MEALRRPARQITDEILAVLEQTTPELVADVARNGIILTGGGAQLWGMDKLITERTGMRCTVADDADSCVAYGCGKSLSWINRMQEGPINFAQVDAFALELGFDGDDERRVDAGILYELSYNSTGGHVFVPEPQLTDATAG